jgi:hypothetical protein
MSDSPTTRQVILLGGLDADGSRLNDTSGYQLAISRPTEFWPIAALPSATHQAPSCGWLAPWDLLGAWTPVFEWQQWSTAVGTCQRSWPERLHGLLKLSEAHQDIDVCAAARKITRLCAPARRSRQRRNAEYSSAMAMVGRHEVAIISIGDGCVIPLQRPWSQAAC